MNKLSLNFKNNLISSVASVAGAKFVQLSLDPGKGLSKHKTANYLNLIVLTGKIKFTVDDITADMYASDMITVDPEVEHEVLAEETSTVLLVLIPRTNVQEVSNKENGNNIDYENAYTKPELLKKIAPEIQPLVKDHIELCQQLETMKQNPTHHEIEALLKVIACELDSHFVAEEKLLFPYIASHLGGEDVGPVPRLLEEHQKIRIINEEANQLFEVVSTQSDDHAKHLIVEKINQLADILLKHLGKEDSHLFPMASRILSKEELTKISEGLTSYAHSD